MTRIPQRRAARLLAGVTSAVALVATLLMAPPAHAVPDGITWTTRTSPADNDWMSVAYGGGLFVAVARSGVGNRVMTSPDGITWTIRTSAADNPWNSVAYGAGLFVAVAFSGAGNRVMTSPDGITWTIRTSAADNGWTSLAYGGGLFVAVATDGVGNRVMTSPDGITWTIRTSAADVNWTSVVHGGGLFVAVAGYVAGVGSGVMTSTDGITWTLRTSAADIYWYSVAYGGGLFVAVATNGVGNRVMTSPDGITWTIRTSAADNAWAGVAYAAGLFVAVAGDGGAGNRVMTSPDGITWTIRSSPSSPDGSGGSGGSTAAQVAPAVPEPQSLPPVAGVAPASTVPPCGSTGSVNGVPVTTTIEVTPAGGVQISGGGSTVTFATAGPGGTPLTASCGGLASTIRLAPGDGLAGTQGGGLMAGASGFLPQSQADVYLYTEQLWLGKATVGAGGTAAMSLTIPSWVTPGGHTLQFVGYQGPYTSIALSTGITVTTPAAENTTASASGTTTASFRPGAVALRSAAKARLWNAVNRPAPGNSGAVVSCVVTHTKPGTATERALWAQRKIGITGFLTRAGCDTVTARLGDLAGIEGATNLAIRVTSTAR